MALFDAFIVGVWVASPCVLVATFLKVRAAFLAADEVPDLPDPAE